MTEPEKMELTSMSITQDQKAKLKQVFPEVFNEDKIDFDKLRRTLGEEIDEGEERFGMTWPGKNDCFKVIQQPSIGTLKPVKDESVNWDATQNLFIEGDNLEVLKLFQRPYYGKIKLIYIDPPYNTGKEFVYPDKFSESLETYLAYTGQVDAEGMKFSTNTEAEGRFHSNWISMMYPRLFLARNLLRDDGVVFISIDDNEVANLRKICDEIFGEENRLDRGSLIWINKGSTKGFRKIVKNHEYILAYGKNADLVESCYGLNFPNKLSDLEHYCFNNPNPGNPICEIMFKAGCRIEGLDDIVFEKEVGSDVKLEIVNSKMVFKNGVLENDVILQGAFPYRDQIEEYFRNFGTDKPTYDVKGQRWLEIYFNSNGMPRYRKERNNLFISSIIDDENIPNYGAKRIKDLFGKKEIFSFPKPFELLQHILSFFAPKDGLVLDIMAGSCSAADAVIRLNTEDGGRRKFIMVQLPEPCEEKSEAFKAGYKTVADIGKERIRRVIQKIEEEQATKAKDAQGALPGMGEEQAKFDLGFKVFKLDKSNFNIWDGTVEEGSDIEGQLKLAIDHIDPDSSDEDILYELLLKSGFELTTTIHQLQLAGKEVYSIADSALLICLDRKLTKEVITEMARLQPARVVCLDAGFADNDQLKTNAVQIMKSHDVEDFRTV